MSSGPEHSSDRDPFRTRTGDGILVGQRRFLPAKPGFDARFLSECGGRREPRQHWRTHRPLRDHRGSRRRRHGRRLQGARLAIDRDVAIKVLAADVAVNFNALQRFLVEARAAGRLNHANAVAIYEIGEPAGIHYLIMEFVAGGSVAARVERDGALRARSHAHHRGRRKWPGRRPPGRNRPSRHEAGQPSGRGGRHDQDCRLRPGQANRRHATISSRAKARFSARRIS